MILADNTNKEDSLSVAILPDIATIISTPDTSLPLVKLSTLDAIKETRAVHSKKAWMTFFEDRVPPLLYYGDANKVPIMSAEIYGAAEEWFILGDIHGDYYALRNTVDYIKSICPGFRLIFLGDLIDRGPHPMECLWYLLNLAKDYPQRILWLAGNHDIGVTYSEQSDQFHSTVYPSEFINHLNHVDSWAPFRKMFGLEYVELVANLPRAVLLPDGTLITHGGFPLVDLQDQLSETNDYVAWLNSENALKDFTWTRITRYKMKLPNRASTGCSYGFDDFAKFCEATKSFFPAKRLVTGHNHPEGGYDKHSNWLTNAALTLTGYGFDDAYENPEAFNALYRHVLIIGRCCQDAIPEVIEVLVDKADLVSFFEQEISQYFPDVVNVDTKKMVKFDAKLQVFMDKFRKK
jgi:hypothetical protein